MQKAGEPLGFATASCKKNGLSNRQEQVEQKVEN